MTGNSNVLPEGKRLSADYLSWELWELKYIACALDTEGYLACNWTGERGKRILNFSFIITNNSLDWLREVQKLLKVKTSIYHDKREGAHSHYLAVSKRQIGLILPALLPHLIIKREAAEEVLHQLEIN